MTDAQQRTWQQRDVEFTAGDVLLRGRLRTPASAGPHPLVILAHGLGGLKEWTIPDVATALVDAGIAAMAFDYRNFGDSDGQPRDEIDHCGQIEDWRSAVTFATTLPEVDRDRIGVWGTSLGGRNVLALAALDRRVACVLAQVPVIDILVPPGGDPADIGELGAMVIGSDLGQFNQVLAQDRRDRALGEQPRYIEFGEADPSTPAGSYKATFGDEERRNDHARVTLRSFEQTLAHDIRHLVPLIAPTPLRMILADQDTTCPFPIALEAYVSAREPKSLVVLPGHHYSLYTTWKDVAISVAREFFVEHLTPQNPNDPGGATSRSTATL